MMNILHKSLTIAFLAASIFISGLNVDFVGAQNTVLDPVTIQLRWFHQFQFAGYYAAIEKGFYADEGLQVSLREFEPGKDRIAPILEGKAQYGVGGPALLNLRAQGKPVVVLAQIFQYSPSVLITLRESGIFGPEGLAGKRVMITRDDIGSAPIQIMILETLGNLDSVELVTHSYRYEDLVEGSVDAISAYRSNEPFRMKQQGVNVNIIDPRSYRIDFYGDNLFTTDQELKEHHERAEKVVRATLKGWEYALKHKDEIIQLIRKTYAPALSLDQLRYEAKVIDQMIMPDLIAIGDINPKRYERIAETYHRLGMLKKAEIPAGFLHGPREHMVDLTPEEQAWIKAHPVVTVGVRDHPPAQFSDDGVFRGYWVEMMEAMLRLVGLRPNYHFSSLSGINKGLREGNIDVGLAYFKTPERSEYLNYSFQELPVNVAIFAQTQRTDISDLASLRGKTIGSYKDYGLETALKALYPDSPIVQAVDVMGMLQLVATGQADFCVQEINSGNYHLQKEHITNVESKGFFQPPGGETKHAHGYVVRKSLSNLTSILHKAERSMDSAEKQRIWNRWFSSSAPARLQPTISLTPEERAWLAAHPNIQLGFTGAFEPTLIVDPDGSYRGSLVDILDALNTRLGTHITLRVDPTPIMFEKAKTKETDGLALLLPDYADKLGLLKTHTYFRSYPTVFGNVDASFEHLDDFIGKKVAIIDKIASSKKVIQPYKDSVTVLKVKDAREGLEMVSKKEADLFIGMSPHNYLLIKYRFFGVGSKYVIYEPSYNFGMAIRPDWPELVSILNKGLSSFSEQEIDALVAKWVQLPSQKEVIELTAEEQAWLAQNHTVRVRVTDHAPYLYSKDGKPVGIAVDMVNAVSERTGIKFHFVMPSPPFSADLKGLIQHAGPDLISTLSPTPEREKVILFTKPYVSTPRFIFTRDAAEFVASMENLSGKTVAVIKDYLVQKELAKNYPDINLLFCKDNEDALRAVSSGKAFAFIGGLLSTATMINKFGLNNLKASAPSSLSGGTVAMGIRSDWPELRDIMNKALDAIPSYKKAAIVTPIKQLGPKIARFRSRRYC